MALNRNKTVIPKDILVNMVAECKGNREEILNKALQYIEEKGEDIKIYIWMSRKLYLKKNGAFYNFEQDNADAIKKINEIIDYTKKLKKLLPSADLIDNYSLDNNDENDSGYNKSTLERFLQAYIWSTSSYEEDYDILEAEKKFESYRDFIGLLEYQSIVFEEVGNSLFRLKKKKGRPITARHLEGFIKQIAHLYEASTGKKFTANKYGDEDYDSEGMRFAEKALPILYTVDSGVYRDFKDNPNYFPFTYENFRNACDYVIKSLGNKKPKTS